MCVYFAVRPNKPVEAGQALHTNSIFFYFAGLRKSLWNYIFMFSFPVLQQPYLPLTDEFAMMYCSSFANYELVHCHRSIGVVLASVLQIGIILLMEFWSFFPVCSSSVEKGKPHIDFVSKQTEIVIDLEKKKTN